MKGTIRITDKVYFEYYKFLKPAMGNPNYDVSWKLYEASKQLIEVKNVAKSKYSKYWFFNVIRDKFGKIEGKAVKNNQPCTAEIKGESAIIIELTKE